MQEPFVVTLNRKTKNNFFVPPPPVFAKTLKTEVDLKIGHILGRFVHNFNDVPWNSWMKSGNEFFFVSQEHSKLNYENFWKFYSLPCPDEKLLLETPKSTLKTTFLVIAENQGCPNLWARSAGNTYTKTSPTLILKSLQNIKLIVRHWLVTLTDIWHTYVV